MVYGLEFQIRKIRKILLSVNPSWKPCCSSPVMVPVSLNRNEFRERIIGGGTDQCNQCRTSSPWRRPIAFWSEPGANELRDDQGIGLRNPDTGLLQPYHLAGAMIPTSPSPSPKVIHVKTVWNNWRKCSASWKSAVSIFS